MKYLVSPVPPFAANAPGNPGANERIFTISPEHSSLVLTLRDFFNLSQVSGSLAQVSVGSDGEVWGVDASGKIFRRRDSSWTQIGGTLSQVSVGSAEHIWGVQADGDVFRRNGNSWSRVGGHFKQLSVANDGTVWGVQNDGDIFVRRPDGWEKIGGKLSQVAVGSRTNVWGVQANGNVFVRQGPRWIKTTGKLKQVAISADGACWGIHFDNNRLLRWNGDGWDDTGVVRKQVSVGSASVVWAVDDNDRIWENKGSGAQLVQQLWAEDTRQQWRLLRQDDGTYRIQNVHSGLVMDVRGSSKSQGTDVLGFKWHGGDNQRWHITDLNDGRFRIRAKHSGMSLDVFKAHIEGGTKVIQFPWHGHPNQRFRLAEVRPSSAIFNESATLFDQHNFAGNSLAFGVGCYGFKDISVLGNDRVSSLKVPAGLRVTLCEHADYKGRRKSFTADAADVGNDFNNRTSSLMVEKVVTIFEHSHYKGKSSTIGIGKHNLNELGIPNDSLSSLRVPQGLVVITYEHNNFEGAQRIYFEDTKSVGSGFHDKVSSIIIRKIGLEIPRDSLRYGGGIQLRGARGRWLVAGNNGSLKHTSTQPGTKETFIIERNGPTQHTSHVAYGDIVSLRSFANKYVVAEPDGTANANRVEAKSLERWVVVRNGPTRSNVFVSHGDVISLRSAANLYLVADRDNEVNANREQPKSLERWTITGYKPPNNLALVTANNETTTAAAGGGPCGAAVCSVNVCAAEACGADACAAEACAVDAALAGACAVAAGGVIVCGADVGILSGCGAAACGAAACGAEACGVAACGAAATGVGVCGAEAFGIGVCGAAACGADACGVAACGAEACGTAACGLDLNPVDACGADGAGIDVCPADACGANVCGLNLCPADACAADACAIDIIPIIPGI